MRMELTPSKLNETHTRLVIDASVLINVLGTGCPAQVLQCLCRVFAIDQITLNEVDTDPATRKSSKEILDSLKSQGLLEVVQMDNEAYERFLSFTSASSPDDLDDGEAATLSHAAQGVYVAVIDERKAIRIASIHTPAIPVLHSIDLLAAPEILNQLGRDRSANIIYMALRNARMRIPSDVRQWITTLLGDVRAQECPGLRLNSTTPRAP